MKFFATVFCLFIFAFNSFAQNAEQVLATANGQNFTARDLPPGIVREGFVKLPETIAALRTTLLEQQIADALLETEAKAQKTTVKKLSETEIKRRVANPTEAQIKALYDANREALGEKTLAQVRPEIVAFLRREPEQKALHDYIEILKTKHKVITGKDVNAPNLKPANILETIGGKQITAQSFEEKARLNLYETQIEVYDQVSDALEQMIYSALISAEAKRLGIQPEDFIAREITGKMKDYSQEERAQLESALQKRLFEKYNAKILLREPAPFVQKISVDDDPTRGNPKAPVTVVMFTDFQCPACSATHPVLQSVLAAYGDKVRLVVRDFPLTQIHNNSFNAAQAAGAANAQGKFFEYIELLYKNQNSLDTASLKRFAAEIGLNQKQFDADLTSGRFAAEIKKDMAEGDAYGIGGTPTIFVNGVKVRRLSVKAFRDAIDRALQSQR